MLLKIRQVGEPVLRQRARDVTPEEIGSDGLAQLIELMRLTMRDAPGVGLAAPQIGVPLRLCVIEDPDEYQQSLPSEDLTARERAPVPFQVLINPHLTVEDPAPVEFFEGCLSLDGFAALVPRARAVRLEALDENGRPVAYVARGWHARILQHEIDHLDGILYIDRMYTRSLTTVENSGRYWRRPIDEVRAALGLDR
jgi:peptide deformylase